MLCMAALSACHDNDELIEFGISEHELLFEANGGEGTIEVRAPEGWTASCDREWCMVTPSNGNSSTVCEIRVDSSYLYTEREAHLNFHCGSKSRVVTIKQFGYEKVIKLEKTEIEVPDFTDHDALFEMVKVESNVNYDVTIEYEDLTRTGWLKARKEAPQTGSIPRPGQVRLDFEMYVASDKDRVATVIFRQNDAKAGETPVESRLIFRQTKAQEIIPSREGDSLALLTLSRMMHLTEGWDTSQPMIHWNNVQLEDITYFNAKEGKTITEPRVVAARFSFFDTDKGIPYHVRYLDQLRSLSFTANSNAHIKRIDLGTDVCTLKHLKTLSLVGYGITSLPAAMKDMVNLEELELSGNNISVLPIDIITALDKHKLKYINLANNRRKDVFGRLHEYASVRDTLGLHGELPEELFMLKNVQYIGLSYNYFEGSIPDMGYDASKYSTTKEKVEHNTVMPQLEQLSINLNFLTGALPDWILYHPNLRCWDPYTLVFNQYESSKDSQGRKTGFDNEPASIEQACTIWDVEEEDAKDSNANYVTRLYNRKNTFDPHMLYDMLMEEAVRR